MRLTILGCAGSMPGPDSPASSYLVEAEGYRLLLDLGSGALGSLQRYGLLYDIDTVIISHLHPDHCADLAAYLVARKYYPPAGVTLPRIPVHGPAGIADRIADICGPGLGSYVRETFDFCTLLPGELEVGPFTVRLDRVNHPVETFASRVEHDGKVLTYSADTGQSEALVELARGSDLFLCEAVFRDGDNNPPDTHLSGKQAGEHAARAEAKKLVLTHTVSAVVDPLELVKEASLAFTGEVELARPDRTYWL